MASCQQGVNISEMLEHLIQDDHIEPAFACDVLHWPGMDIEPFSCEPAQTGLVHFVGVQPPLRRSVGTKQPQQASRSASHIKDVCSGWRQSSNDPYLSALHPISSPPQETRERLEAVGLVRRWIYDIEAFRNWPIGQVHQPAGLGLEEQELVNAGAVLKVLGRGDQARSMVVQEQAVSSFSGQQRSSCGVITHLNAPQRKSGSTSCPEDALALHRRGRPSATSRADPRRTTSLGCRCWPKNLFPEHAIQLDAGAAEANGEAARWCESPAGTSGSGWSGKSDGKHGLPP